MKNSIGSVWRKWDLHVHAPNTKLNNQYSASDEGNIWDEFCKRIEESDVQSFGIADYFSIDGYISFMKEFKERYPESNKVFFPNIELRTSYAVNSAQEEVNMHLIFNPSIPNFDQLAKKFLQHLNTNKTAANGGPHIKASELLSKNDFEEATTTKEFIENAFKETYGDKIDLTDYVLIFTAANNDGIRSVPGVKRKAIITDELDKFSSGFFGNSSNTDYFLKKNRLEGEEEAMPKPVISGCDAHSFSDINAWLGKMVKEGEILKQSTWIKADLTFEGLKYITYEPHERVFIGEKPEIDLRVLSNQTKYIKSLHINHVENYNGRHGKWFDSEIIDLNPGLAAIIGNKGSGKSALTDIIGLLGNSYNQNCPGANGHVEELFSFLNKEKFIKGHCASSFIGELHWHAGDPDNKSLESTIDQNFPEKVEYLPQKYLEKICSNIDDNEFRSKLNEVIFEYVDKQGRYKKNNLEELIEYLTCQTDEDIKIIKESLHEINEKIVTIENKLSSDYKKLLEEKKKLKDEEIESHTKLKPPEVSKPTRNDSSRETASLDIDLGRINNSIVELRTEQTEVSKNIEDFSQIKQAIVRQASNLANLQDKYKLQLEAAGIKFEDIVTLSLDYSKIDEFIRIKQTRLDEINELLISEEEIISLELDEISQNQALEKSLLYNQLKLEKARRDLIDKLDKPNQEYQSYIREQEVWEKRNKELIGDENNPEIDTLNWLKKEITAITSDYSTELNSLKEQRKVVVEKLFEKKSSVTSFYNSVKQSIDGEIKKYSEELGEYDISIEANFRFNKLFYDNFFSFINQGVRGSFHGSEDGRSVLKKIVEEVTDWQDKTTVFIFLDSLVSHINTDKRKLSSDTDNIVDVFKQMKSGKNPVDFYDYIFGFDYLETKYDLKVDEKDLSELSPGERGGVLLIFYLMLDRRDIPLVIDQPEDNLDNKSVYEILVTFLKKAKKRRQIIMVTHNPNLAVVADAEQIIHVSIDKKNNNDFDFYSGSIENHDINKCVVDILEGTLPAFDNRKIKYKK